MMLQGLRCNSVSGPGTPNWRNLANPGSYPDGLAIGGCQHSGTWLQRAEPHRATESLDRAPRRLCHRDSLPLACPLSSLPLPRNASRWTRCEWEWLPSNEGA